MSERDEAGHGTTDRDAIREGATSLRDVRCGELRADHEGREVRLAGWVHRRRDLGGLIFVDLRDRAGLVQLSFGPEWSGEEALALAEELSAEDVLRVRGRVAARPEEAVNPEMDTGAVEVHVLEARRLSAADPLPILVAQPPSEELPSEELRLEHRYLDLRRPEMQRSLMVRHRALAAARRSLEASGFVEVETPFLTRRTPEGARDFLVPSRMHPGEVYALPQSPQIYKQILMTSGLDRYYQVARCLRDEDLRADRQPEFTQIDAEMSFVGESDVKAVCEEMLAEMWTVAGAPRPETPFPVLTHEEALERYGTDKPDLRIPWEIRDLSEVLTGIGFRIFDGAVEAGGRVRGLRVPGGAELSRSRLDELDGLALDRGAKGVLWLKLEANGWSGGAAAAAVEDGAAGALRAAADLEEGDLLLLVAGPDGETGPALDALRRRCAELLDAVGEDGRFAWITDFPLFHRDPETGAPVPSHHPFTMPATDDPEEILERPLEVGSEAYDVVYDGTEICSGSIRCHRPDLQRAVFSVLGLEPEEMDEKFGFLLRAFRYGVPPHGGFAVGVDRVVALMVGAESIRDVIAFPKTAAGRGLMERAPSPADPDELAELGLRLE